MTTHIELVKSNELEQLRQLSITTFKTTFEDGGYTDEDFEQYFNEAYNLEQLNKELENKSSFTYFYKENKEVVGYFKLNINQAQSEEKRQ